MSLPARLETENPPHVRSGVLKAARLMRELGPAASAVWSELSEEEANQLSVAINAMPHQAASSAPTESDALVFALRTQASSADTHQTGAVWDSLSGLDPAAIARCFESENPQVIAVILSRLAPETAARTVRALPRPVATDALRRLLHIGRVRAEALNVIEQAVSDLLQSSAGRLGRDGHEAVARIFDQMESDADRSLLSSLNEAEPGSGARIRALMFTFEDLAGLGPAAVQTILSSVDRTTLATALKGAKPAIHATFLKNMTQRAGDMLTAEIDSIGPVRRSDVEAARLEITRLARSLAKRGDILSIVRREDELIE